MLATAPIARTSEHVLDTDSVLKIMNDYYNLKGDERDDYPEELRGFYDLWHVDKAEVERRLRGDLAEVKKARVADTINAMAEYLEKLGADASQYKAPHGRFYIRMATDIDPEKPDGFYRDEKIALFMREALSFVNILTKEPTSGEPLSKEKRLARINSYLTMFPTADNDLYRCLAGVRDAQMTVYMALKAEEMPWNDRVIVECHRDYIEQWRAKVVRYIDEAYVVHTFSALEHLFGIESKEKDTLAAMSAIPAETACMVIAQYQRELQEKINERIAKDRAEIVMHMSEANKKGYLLGKDFDEMRNFLRIKGIVNINVDGANVDVAEYLKKAKTVSIEDEEYDGHEWDLQKISNIFPDIKVRNSLMGRPESLFDSDASEYVARMIRSDDEKYCKAGLQYLALIGLDSQAGNNMSQFLNFIHQVGILQGSDHRVALDAGIDYIKTKFPDNDVAQKIISAYEAIPAEYERYKSALQTNVKPTLDGILTAGRFYEIREIIDENPLYSLEILKANKKILSNLIHHPRALYILNAIFHKKNALNPEDLKELGKNLAFLAAKYDIKLKAAEDREIHLLDYIKSGISPDFREHFRHQEIGYIMLEDGLSYSDIDIDGSEVSGLEYLVRKNSRKLGELYGIPLVFSPRAIETMLERALSDGQNLIHKLAKRGDTAVMMGILALVRPDKIGHLLTICARDSKKTALHFAVENAILNPSQSGIIDVLMREMSKVGALDFDMWMSDEKNSLMIAIDSERTDIIARIAGNLTKYNLNILLETLYKGGKFLASASIVKALIAKLPEDAKGHLLFHYAATGDFTAFETIANSLDNIFIATEIDGNMMSPLHVAVKSGNVDVIDCWMDREKKRGVIFSLPSSARDSNSKTALMMAVDVDKLDIANLLIDKGAAFNDDEQKYIFKKILRQLRELKVQLYGGEDVMEEIKNKQDFLSMLLDTKQVQKIVKTSDQNPPLLSVVSKYRAELAWALLEIGKADIEQVSQLRGDTILHYACRYDEHELIKYLTDRPEQGGLGMNPEVKNASGKEPIEMASSKEAKLFMRHAKAARAGAVQEGSLADVRSPAGLPGLSPLNTGAKSATSNVIGK